MRKNRSRALLILGAFAAIYLIWGSTYLAVLFALDGFPPFFLAGIRFMGAGILLLIWRLLKGEGLPTGSALKKNAIRGILMLVGGTGTVIWAEKYVPSGYTAIMVAVEPFWFVLLDKRQWKNYFSDRIIVAGLIAGFIGILLLVGWNPIPSRIPGIGLMPLWCTLILQLGGISWVLGSLYTRYSPSPGSPWMHITIQFLVAGSFCLLLSMVSGEIHHFPRASDYSRVIASLIYLILFGSILTYTAFVWLIRIKPPALVSTHTYVNPVVAVLLGTLFAGESFSLRQWLALLVVLGGVLLVNLPRYFAKKSPGIRGDDLGEFG